MCELCLSSGNYLKFSEFQDTSFNWVSAGKIHDNREAVSGAGGTGLSEHLIPPMKWGVTPLTSQWRDWGAAAPTSLHVPEEVGVGDGSRETEESHWFPAPPNIAEVLGETSSITLQNSSTINHLKSFLKSFKNK